MHKHIFIIVTMSAMACTSAGDSREDGAADTSGADDGMDETTTTMTSTAGVTTSATSVTSTTAPETTDGSSDASTGSGDAFHFDDTPPEQYAQVDRIGMPAVATVLITSKDLYNQSTPQDDADGTFVAEIAEHIDGLHKALDDDLAGLGLVPCTVDVCIDQGAPLVLPDTIKIDLGAEPGFPNGRRTTDPVVDITLAVLLLDLGSESVTTFADLPLNPSMGDVDPPAEFPYFAVPH